MIKKKKVTYVLCTLLICASPTTYCMSSLGNRLAQSCINRASRFFSFAKQHPKITIATTTTCAIMLAVRQFNKRKNEWLAKALHRKQSWRSLLLTICGANVPKHNKDSLISKLIKAIRQGNYDEANMYINSGIKIPNNRANDLAEELFDSITQENINKADCFVNAGVSLETEPRAGALIIRLLRRSYDDCLATKQAGNPEMPGQNNRAALKLANLLTMAGGKINANNQEAIQLFHLATHEGNKTVALMLINAGININVTNQETGDTAMHIAAHHGYTGIIQSLLTHKATINTPNNLGETPLLKAVMARDHQTVKFLLNHNIINVNRAAINGTTPLIYAARHGLVDIATSLLKHPNINKNLTDAQGHTALDLASTEAIRTLLATTAQ